MIAIYGKSFSAANAEHLRGMFDYLDKKGMRYAVEENFFKLLKDKIGLSIKVETFNNFGAVKSETEIVFSIGGDGTILDAVVMVKESEIPIFGINFGRLGFLASLGKDQVQAAIDAVESRRYFVERRTLIELNSNKPLFDYPYALNDMTIQRRDQSSMITVNTYLNGEPY